MSPLSPYRVYSWPLGNLFTGHMTSAESEAWRLLRNDLYMRLEEAEYLAEYDTWSVKQQRSARAVIPNLVTVIRGLVVLHDGPNGKCPACRSSWPCAVFEQIHRLVKNPDAEFVKLVGARREQRLVSGDPDNS